MADARDRFEYGLAHFYRVMVLVRYHPLAVLPGHLRSDEWIAGTTAIPLEYGLDMPVPIDDMRITKNGVSATLSFSRIPLETYVPWEAMILIEGVDPRPPEKSSFKLKLVP